MSTPLYWISVSTPLRLAVAPHPAPGDWLAGDLSAWRHAGVDTIVSLLTAEEIKTLQLEKEPTACATAGLAYVSLSIPDRETPERLIPALQHIRAWHRMLQSGSVMVIHCRQGLGRAALVAAGILIVAGSTPDDAIAQVSTARGCPVPETPAQHIWLQALPLRLALF